MADQTISLQVQIDAVNSAKTLGDLNNAIEQLKNALTQVGTGAANFSKISASISGAEEKAKSLQTSVSNLGSQGDKVNALGDLGKRIASGFEAAKTAADLFGASGTELQTILADVQKGTELAQAAEIAFGASATAAEAAATGGISLIIGAGIGLFAYLTTRKEKTEDATAAEKKLAEAEKEQADFRDQVAGNAAKDVAQLESAIAVINDQTQSIGTRNDKVKELQNLYPAYLSNLSVENANTQNIANTINDKLIPALIAKAQYEAIQDKISAKAKEYVSAIENQKKATTDLDAATSKLSENELERLNSSGYISNTGFNHLTNKELAYIHLKEAATLANNAVDTLKGDLKNLFNESAEAAKNTGTLLEKVSGTPSNAQPGSIAFYETRLAAVSEELKNTNPNYEAYNKLLSEQIELQRKLNQAQEEADNKVKKTRGDVDIPELSQKPVTGIDINEPDEKAPELLDPEVVKQKARNDQLFKLQTDFSKMSADEYNKYKKDRQAAGLKANKEEVAQDKQLFDAKLALAQDGLNAITSLGSLFITNQKSLQQFNKDAAVVQLGIDTAKSISSVIVGAVNAAQDTGPGAPFVLAGYIATGIATVLTAFSKAKSILSSSGASGGPGTSASTGAPSLQPTTLNTPTTNLQNPQQPQTAQPQPLKVFVTETDIRNATTRINTINNRAVIH